VIKVALTDFDLLYIYIYKVIPEMHTILSWDVI